MLLHIYPPKDNDSLGGFVFYAISLCIHTFVKIGNPILNLNTGVID